jgi:DNA-directed RNA polymerase subunit F
MSNRSDLNLYIARLQQRLRLGAWLRGAAIFTGTALSLTVVLVFILSRFAFPAHGVTAARLAVFLGLAAAAAFGAALPLIHSTCQEAVRNAEAINPDLQQRLTTFQDREGKGNEGKDNDPFLELLAADTIARAQAIAPSFLVPDNRLFALGGAGIACLFVLLWIIADGPGYLGYGASLLWTPYRNAVPFYKITVTPGDVTVRRNSDQLVTARVTGARPSKAQLFARYRNSSVWEPVTMQAEPDSGGDAAFQFVFAGLPENVEYYVAAGPLVSPHYKVRVVDLPSVKEITVTYHYPSWTGLKPKTGEHSGDLRAIEGTDVEIQVVMDRSLKDGRLILDSGQMIPLTGGTDNKYQGSIHLETDGAYHVAGTQESQQVRLSEDYFIATDKAMPPTVAIERPSGDYRASPIEEVTVRVQADDQFGLSDLHLHYSVNGGPNRDVSLLRSPGAKTSDGSYLLPLEDFKLIPGDLVSLYATAKDGHSEARTDISFLQVEPFERKFSQSQQSGGGGGGGGRGNQTEISKREKELIAATWKQQNDKTATPKDAAASGQFLSEAQQKLRDQVLALSVRMQSRDLSGANQEFTDFDKDMQDAAAAMQPSAAKLKGMQWKDAIPLEQKALQALLRAEATFRQIQVAFGQRGGGGGGSNAGRDLASLFDLELDTEKNQYETVKTASPADQHAKELEDALAKLDALVKRQEDLANQQHNPQQSFQERWQQEMLRREAEQLQRQMEQLARNGGQNGSSAASQDTQEQQSSSSQGAADGRSDTPSSRQQPGEPSSDSPQSQLGDPRIQQALKRLQQAGDAMKRAGGPSQATGPARQAADQLRQASNLLAGTQQQLASEKLDSLAREATRLTQEERAQAGRINNFAGQQTDPDAMDLAAMRARLHERDRLAQDRQQLSDELSNLQRNVRDTAREIASAQPGVAQKLRDALTGMDESDLDNHVQRTADWLRRGINPNSNGTESEIAQGLDHLSRQLQQAEKGIGQGKPAPHGSDPSDANEALDQVERLRGQIEAMADSREGKGQPAQRNGTGQPRGDPLQRNNNSGGQSGNVPYGGGPASDGTVWGNINTGNNSYRQPGQHPAQADSSANPAETERTYQRSLQALNHLRRMVQNDPQAAKEVEELVRQMQPLDPSRFPGNPAMVEQMHREVLSSVDKLELQLERDSSSTDARTGKSDAVPPGYQESVAEYYRRLSKNP